MPEIEWQGNKVPADSVDLITENETWNEYTLSDGTVLRMKTIVTEVWKIRGETDNDGKPIYVVRSNNIVNARPVTK